MKWRRKALAEIQQRIVQMGLEECPICGTGHLMVWHMPSFESVGDVFRPKEDPQRDPDANINFLVHVECDLCGYVLLFNSERFVDSDTGILVKGSLTEEEEAALEDGQP